MIYLLNKRNFSHFNTTCADFDLMRFTLVVPNLTKCMTQIIIILQKTLFLEQSQTKHNDLSLCNGLIVSILLIGNIFN